MQIDGGLFFLGSRLLKRRQRVSHFSSVRLPITSFAAECNIKNIFSRLSLSPVCNLELNCPHSLSPARVLFLCICLPFSEITSTCQNYFRPFASAVGSSNDSLWSRNRDFIFRSFKFPFSLAVKKAT